MFSPGAQYYSSVSSTAVAQAAEARRTQSRMRGAPNAPAARHRAASNTNTVTTDTYGYRPTSVPMHADMNTGQVPEGNITVKDDEDFFCVDRPPSLHGHNITSIYIEANGIRTGEYDVPHNDTQKAVFWLEYRNSDKKLDMLKLALTNATANVHFISDHGIPLSIVTYGLVYQMGHPYSTETPEKIIMKDNGLVLEVPFMPKHRSIESVRLTAVGIDETIIVHAPLVDGLIPFNNSRQLVMLCGIGGNNFDVTVTFPCDHAVSSFTFKAKPTNQLSQGVNRHVKDELTKMNAAMTASRAPAASRNSLATVMPCVLSTTAQNIPRESTRRNEAVTAMAPAASRNSSGMSRVPTIEIKSIGMESYSVRVTEGELDLKGLKHILGEKVEMMDISLTETRSNQFVISNVDTTAFKETFSEPAQIIFGYEKAIPVNLVFMANQVVHIWDMKDADTEYEIMVTPSSNVHHFPLSDMKEISFGNTRLMLESAVFDREHVYIKKNVPCIDKQNRPKTIQLSRSISKWAAILETTNGETHIVTLSTEYGDF